jgi:hypothetical protein
MRLDTKEQRSVLWHERRRDNPLPRVGPSNYGRKLVLQPDGKIALVGGVAFAGSVIDQCGIARFDATGALDPGFGTGGRVLVPMSIGCFKVNQQRMARW